MGFSMIRRAIVIDIFCAMIVGIATNYLFGSLLLAFGVGLVFFIAGVLLSYKMYYTYICGEFF